MLEWEGVNSKKIVIFHLTTRSHTPGKVNINSSLPNSFEIKQSALMLVMMEQSFFRLNLTSVHGD
jgi:hypothetical protein